MVAMATISWLALISDLFSAITFEPVVRSQNSFFWDHQLKKLGKGTFLHFSKFFTPFWSTAKNGYPNLALGALLRLRRTITFEPSDRFSKSFFWNLYFLMLFDRSCVKSSYFWLDFSENVKNWFSDRNRTPSCFLKEHFFLLDLRPKFWSFYVQIQYFLAMKI